MDREGDAVELETVKQTRTLKIYLISNYFLRIPLYFILKKYQSPFQAEEEEYEISQEHVVEESGESSKNF